MKILIIGGTGVLSTDILQTSIGCGFDVSVLNRGNHNSQIPKEATIYKADIRKINEVDALLHGQSFDVIIDFLSFNAKELERTFDYFKNKCIQYIFISSACVFRRKPEDGIITENSPKPNPNLPYSIGKYECECWLTHNAEKNGCKYTIVRPYITYGNTRIPFGIAPLARFHWTIASRILNGKPMFLWDNGSAKCTLTHTEDFAYNFVQLFLNSNVYNEDINLVGDQVYSWREMLELLYDLLDKGKNKDKIISVPTKQIASILPVYKDFLIGDRSLNAVFDNSKLKSSIPDFRQHISLKDGMTRTLDYYKENNYLSGIDYGYDGRIDRLIEKVCKCHIPFIDYLGTSSHKDRFSYYTHKYLSDSQLRGLRALSRIFKF